MKHLRLWVSGIVMAWSMVLLSGCVVNGEPLVGDQADHQVNMMTATEDAKPTSLTVRNALRKNPQTSLARIRVSQDSDDTVKLTGFVSNDAVRQEAERVAYQVSGVRFVVNNLNIQR